MRSPRWRTRAGSTGITEVRVVIPARNEQDSIQECLMAVEAARDFLQWARPEVRSSTWVVLDSCTDDTESAVVQLGINRVHSAHGRVGAARASGVEAATRGTNPTRTWVACTDADTVVPSAWLAVMLEAAERADLVLGRVRPDPHRTPWPVQRAWWARHPDDIEVVHGANMGFRLSSYLAVGGFNPLDEHEDVDLVARLRAVGARQAVGAEVITSGRLYGRTGGGFAGYLRHLHAEPDSALG